MKILLHLIRHLALDYEVPERVGTQWVDGFQTNATRINEKRLKKVFDSTTYQNRVVGPILKRYPELINPNFISRSGLNARAIIAKHADRLRNSFKKYQEGLDEAFATVDGVEAKRFKDAVARKRGNYMTGMAKRTLPFTGTRAEGLGVAPVVVLWLTADTIAEGILTGNDELLAGKPIRLTKPKRCGGFKAALNQRIIQAGATIVKAIFAQDVIKEENDETNELVQGFVDPALNLFPFGTGDKSHIDFFSEEGKGFYLEVKVTQK